MQWRMKRRIVSVKSIMCLLVECVVVELVV
jgi:hypothetical protein